MKHRRQFKELFETFSKQFLDYPINHTALISQTVQHIIYNVVSNEKENLLLEFQKKTLQNKFK